MLLLLCSFAFVCVQGRCCRSGSWILLDCGLKCVVVQWLVGLDVAGQWLWLGCRCGCWCSLVIGRSRRGILWSLPFVDIEVAAVIEIYGGGAAMA